MNNDTAIKVSHVSKEFKLPHEKQASIKGALISLTRTGRRSRSYERQQVLKDVSFEIKKGEFFGIVGRNGSGKSTLLKMLAGIYTPTKGHIQVDGKLTPFIELGVGFNPELTGRENVFLNGALLGFNRKEVEAMYDDIVEFAELERFMDQKLKNYSSGMQVRLAFSIAVKAETEILLIDEVLAVGDAAFQRKCFDYFMKLKKDKKTVILVTHDMGAARQFCDSGIMIDQGEIVKQGNIERIAQAYQKLFNDEIAANEKRGVSGTDDRWGTKKMRATAVDVAHDEDSIMVAVTYKAYESLDPPVLGFNIYNSRGMNVLEGNTIREDVKTKQLNKDDSLTIKWKFPNILATDTYKISVSCCDKHVSEFYDWYNEAASFVISKKGNTAGFVDPTLTVSVK